jgi:hypothetical protein
MRRILAISSIGNQPHNLHGKYFPGAGVGASSVSTRRLKLYKATPKTTSSQTQPQIQYLSLSDVATYDSYTGQWTLTVNVIASYQYLTITTTDLLSIPAGMTFTNNGRIDNGGIITIVPDAQINNTGVINNSTYGTITINSSRFNTYGDGITNNSGSIDNYGTITTYGGGITNNSGIIGNYGTITITSPSSFNTYGGGATNNYRRNVINNNGIFRVAASGSACGSGTFTNSGTFTGNAVTIGCPP